MRRPPAGALAWTGMMVGLLVMSHGLLHRADIEAANNTFELAMPDSEMIELVHSGLDEAEVYNPLRVAGLTSVAVEMETLEQAEDDGRLVIMDRDEVQALQILGGASFSELVSASGSYIAIVDEDESILDRLTAAVPTSERESVIVSGRRLHLVSGIPNIRSTAIGWNRERIAWLTERGIGVTLRLPAQRISPEFLIAELESVYDEHGIDRIMFTGDGTPFVGSPDLDVEVAQWLAQRDVDVATIEFTEQEGIETYTRRLDVVRLHPLPLATQDSVDVAVDQGVRALKERNVRVLFVRPSTDVAPAFQLEELAEVMAGIVENRPPGTQVGLASPMEALEPSAPLWIGAALASASIAWLVGAVASPILGWLGVAAISVLMAVAAITGSSIVGDVLRLAVAVTFAIGAVVVASPARRLSRATVSYVATVLVVLAGGFTVSALAYDNTFLTNVRDFWGVKALLIVPPATVSLVTIYAVLNGPRPGELLAIGSMPVRAWHLAFLGVGAAVVWYLLLRSDNTGAASDIELLFRQELEDLLYVRPRIKEFIFGFPALLIGIVLASRTRFGLWFYVAGAVATASAIDTFTHFHSPLGISVYRTVLGAAIGYGLGLLGLGVMALLERRPSRLRRGRRR